MDRSTSKCQEWYLEFGLLWAEACMVVTLIRRLPLCHGCLYRWYDGSLGCPMPYLYASLPGQGTECLRATPNHRCMLRRAPSAPSTLKDAFLDVRPIFTGSQVHCPSSCVPALHPSQEKFTPLHLATLSGKDSSLAVCQLLLEHGANTEAADIVRYQAKQGGH